ncbi:MAG TPA: EamA family transporter [Terriglobales bacterium]
MSTAQLHVLPKPATHAARWKILLAFSIIYFVWGSTFLCIRIGVHEIPPFLYAALRFTAAGLALFLWMLAKDKTWPRWQEWVGSSVLGLLMFLIDYGSLFWAEQRVSSGIAAVVLATIPIFITVLEIIFLRTVRLTIGLTLGLVAGIFGVAALMNSSSLGGAPIDRGGAIALLVASLGWAIGTVLTKKLALPASKGMSSALQMLTGGIQLFVLALMAGETRHFRFNQLSGRAWFALFYLIVAGSIIGYTAYVWLLDHESPTKVGTYAYVNPVIAVALGYFLAGEEVGMRTVLGTLLVLASVITIMTGKSRKPEKVKEIAAA